MKSTVVGIFIFFTAVSLHLSGCGGTCTVSDNLSCRWMSSGKTVLSADVQDSVFRSPDGGVIAAEDGPDGDCLVFSVPANGLEAGSAVEFDLTLSCSPESMLTLEYHDGDGWTRFGSFRCGEEYVTSLHTFRLGEDIAEDSLRIRCTAGQDVDFIFPDTGYVAANVSGLGTNVPQDTLKMLVLGNSFTYFYGSTLMLKELAWKEGHFLDISANLKGGQTFGDHLLLELSRKAIADGGYDIALIQDQSQNPARYAENQDIYRQVLEDCVSLAGQIRSHSPGCRIIMDRTWSYPGLDCGGFGDYDVFDRLLAEGTGLMALAAGTETAPVGEAFSLCRDMYPETGLYFPDEKHPSAEGAYLKACVEYLTIFGDNICPETPDFGIPAAEAATLRSIAKRAVSVEKTAE